ncbi:MAG: hypothetical protein CR972_01515 [Candidatus Moraniibacteriota bacterium]|nr:MAG: hypothetical protein CR972_01515 [Candidatus Moranbacteria bacterium]
MKKGIIIFCCIVLAGTVFGFLQKEKNNGEKFVQKVTVFQVNEASHSVEHKFGAIVKNTDEAILSAQVGGNIEFLSVHEGDAVKKGQVVAVVHAGEYVAQYQQAQIMVQSAEQKEKRARRKWDDYKPEERAQIKLDVSRAKAMRDEVSAHLAKTRIVAPFDGFISTKFVQTGSTVTPGLSVLRVIGDMSKTEIVFDVVEDVAQHLSINDIVTVVQKEKQSNAKIYAIDKVANEKTRKVQIHAKLNEESIFHIGDFVNVFVRIATDHQKGSILPVDAVVHFYDDDIVFMVDEKNIVHIVPVNVLYIDGDRAVVEGVSIDDKIIVSGAHSLSDGDFVEIVNEK